MTDKLKVRSSSGDLTRQIRERKSKSVYSKLVFRKIVLQAIRDLCWADRKVAQDAARYVNSEVIDSHIAAAGYPVELKQALIDVIGLSPIQTKVACNAIISELKKTPVLPGSTDHKITGRDNQ